jgi:hypothetical protein
VTVQIDIARKTEDPALDEAVARIRDLAGRLWAVRSAHRPSGPGRRARNRCAGCGQQLPCATLLAAG